MLNYNVPLREHGATIGFECDNAGKKSRIMIDFFGINFDGRWNKILKDAKYKQKILAFTVAESSINPYGLSMVWDIPTNNLDPLNLKRYVDLFQGHTEMTF